MSDFPFGKVYDFLARPILEITLPPEDVLPMMAMIHVESGEIVKMNNFPDDLVVRFFRDSNGKAMLGQAIREAMTTISSVKRFSESACLVLITEAYFKEVNKPPAEEVKRLMKTSLVGDSEAQECMMISIYRPELVRMGALPISADRTVSYREMFPVEGKLKGKFSLAPEEDDLPNGEKFH